MDKIPLLICIDNPKQAKIVSGNKIRDGVAEFKEDLIANERSNVYIKPLIQDETKCIFRFDDQWKCSRFIDETFDNYDPGYGLTYMFYFYDSWEYLKSIGREKRCGSFRNPGHCELGNYIDVKASPEAPFITITGGRLSIPREENQNKTKPPIDLINLNFIILRKNVWFV